MSNSTGFRLIEWNIDFIKHLQNSNAMSKNKRGK